MIKLHWFEKLIIFLTIYIIILTSKFAENTYTDYLNNFGKIFYGTIYILLTAGISSIIIKIITRDNKIK
ncbi:MAG TPA: hypothetical protein VJK51_03320 [Candidatus Nanoarchaeia archaeon]|nr:hypothetical protein [Candidatus Nanoarchaeia archaeon]